MAKKTKEKIEEINYVEKIEECINLLLDLNKYTVSEYKDISKEKCANSYLTSVKISGSSGGNCWGDGSSTFSEHSNDIKDSIKSGIAYYLRDILKSRGLDEYLFSESFAEEAYNKSEIAERTDNEYYGNCTDYGCYAIPIISIITKFKDFGIINEEEFNIINDKFKQTALGIEEDLNIKEKKEEYETLCVKIETFENNKILELQKVKNDLERTLESVKFLEKKIESFDNVKTTELKNLIKTKNKLESEFGDHLNIEKPKAKNKIK